MPRAEAFRVASQVVQSRRTMPHRTTAKPAELPAPKPSTFTGVNFSDAAAGEIALIVYIGGKRVIRLEIAQEFYSSRWFRWLDRWAKRQQPHMLKLVE